MSPEPVAIAVLAKAPLPGLAKTRLIPTLGAHGAAFLQERMTERVVEAACTAAVGPVTLWCTPDDRHAAFCELTERFPIALARQPDGDLGHRMFTAIADAAGACIAIGTDCPVLTADHLQQAADALRRPVDVVVTPADDGGYVLIGMHRPHARLFTDMTWSTAGVMAETRARLTALGLTSQELPQLWDVDMPDDLDRLQRSGLGDLIGG